MKMNCKEYICRVCGYVYDEPVWVNGHGTFDMCLCCGVTFGYQDCLLKAIVKYRAEWIQNNCSWSFPKLRPEDWSFAEQYKNVPEKFKLNNEKISD